MAGSSHWRLILFFLKKKYQRGEFESKKCNSREKNIIIVQFCIQFLAQEFERPRRGTPHLHEGAKCGMLSHLQVFLKLGGCKQISDLPTTTTTTIAAAAAAIITITAKQTFKGGNEVCRHGKIVWIT